MLSSADKLDLIDALCVTAEAMGTTLTPNAAKTMADDLELFSVNDLVIALQSCRRELTGRLTLAAILQRAQAADGRPDKDEAWAIALASSDEYDTVVMTDEIQVALGAARPVLDLGDKVGARMAFIKAYERLIHKARDEAIPVNWHVSIGFDANRRVEAIAAAVQMKRIPQERGTLYLADLNVAPVTQDGLAIAGLLTGKAAMPTPKIREKLKAIKDSMLAMRRANDAEKDEMRIAAANELADRRALMPQAGQGTGIEEGRPMTPAQQITVDQLKSQGFELIVEGREIVRMTKGSDKRVICQNGSQKRGNHTDMRKGIRA